MPQHCGPPYCQYFDPIIPILIITNRTQQILYILFSETLSLTLTREEVPIYFLFSILPCQSFAQTQFRDLCHIF